MKRGVLGRCSSTEDRKLLTYRLQIAKIRSLRLPESRRLVSDGVNKGCLAGDAFDFSELDTDPFDLERLR